MKKKICKTSQKLQTLLSLIIVLFLTQNIAAQNLQQSIRGTVVDRDSKTPLPGVNLVIQGSTPVIGVVSGDEGDFKFDRLTIGRYNIEVFCMGYEPSVVSNILLDAGKEVVLNIELSEDINLIDEVVISSEKQKGDITNDMAIISARSFSVEETMRYAGSYNDPSRMASSYAGVVGNPSGDNDIIIRGNSPRGLLWRLEGMEIPNPNHFADEGASGGPISILNSNMLRNSDFYTGAFPAEYGNALSGVFDINLRKGNNENREYSFMAGLLGIDCSVEGPFVEGKNASYLLNYRYSTLAMLNGIGIKITGDAVPKFQDLSFNINVPTKKSGIFSLFGVGGLSKIVEEMDDYIYSEKSDMGAIGMSHTYFLNNDTYIKTIVGLTGTRSIVSYQEPNPEQIFNTLEDQKINYWNARASITFNKKFDARNTLKTGLIYTNMNFDLNIKENYDEYASLLPIAVQSGTTDKVQGFINWKFRLTSDITLLSGVHYMQFMLNNNNSIEPRLGIQWQINDKHSVNTGFGIHSKVETISNYFANTKEGNEPEYGNKELDFPKSRHYVLGYNNRISPYLSLKIELYYQDLYNIAVSKDTSDAFSSLNYADGICNFNLENTGTGYNYGTEITLEKYFSNNYYFMFTTSLYESKYKGSDQVLRNTRYNGNYVFNLLGGKEIPLKKNKTLSINIRASWAGGLRYTPIDLERSIQENETVRSLEKINVLKRDDFVRVDLKLKYRINKKKTTRYWEVDVQNVTNMLNVAGDYFNSTKGEIETYTQMGILPILSYRIEF
jgi:hypothetical protein